MENLGLNALDPRLREDDGIVRGTLQYDLASCLPEKP